MMLGPVTSDPTMDTSSLDMCRAVVEDSPSKLFIGGLQCDWSEEEVKGLLAPYGSLKSFNLVMDKVTGKSKVGGGAGADAHEHSHVLVMCVATCW
jgi:hypothetical protein